MHSKDWLLILFLLVGCENLDYKKPALPAAPEHFLEAGISWEQARPNENYSKGQWWKLYNNPILNDLEDKLNNNNQDIIAAEHSYKSAIALITEARAAYFPTIGGSESLTHQKNVASPSSNQSQYTYNKSMALTFSSAWEIDIFNQQKYSVNSNAAAAKAAQANWEFIKLSEQTSLAQYYFELCALDVIQKNLDEIIVANLAGVKYDQNRYKAGVDDQLTLMNYQNNHQLAIQAAKNNHIIRQQYQHAIAVLIGANPSTFILTPNYQTNFSPITIPSMLPSQLVERRPDVAQAEYLVMQANAQVGVARSAFFPALNLGISGALQNSNNLGPLQSLPQFIWSIGPSLSFALFDGGARKAVTKSAKALYEAQVANYRNIVLTAFQEVEDQLVAIYYLNDQEIALKKIVNNNAKNLNLTRNQYNSGIIDQYAVLTAQINYANAVANLATVQSLQKSSEITLIKDLGGGWQQNELVNH